MNICGLLRAATIIQLNKYVCIHILYAATVMYKYVIHMFVHSLSIYIIMCVGVHVSVRCTLWIHSMSNVL